MLLVVHCTICTMLHHTALCYAMLYTISLIRSSSVLCSYFFVVRSIHLCLSLTLLSLCTFNTYQTLPIFSLPGFHFRLSTCGVLIVALWRRAFSLSRSSHSGTSTISERTQSEAERAWATGDWEEGSLPQLVHSVAFSRIRP